MTETINTRELIMNILLEMDREEIPCHIAVRSALEKYQYLPHKDRAFVKRVCEGTTEYQLQNDYIINQYSKIRIHKCKPVIRAILRMSVYQIRFMDAVPDSAVVNEAVKLTEKKHFTNLKGFVNGVLRSIAREKEHLPMPDPSNRIEYLSVRYSVPEFLVEEWLDQYGEETALGMMEAFLIEKPVTIRMNRYQNTVDETMASLEKQGVVVEKAPYLPEAYYIRNFDRISGLRAFEEGRFQVQDVSSMLVAEAADPRGNDEVLDLCAAPGGKSLHMADKMLDCGYVEARDLSDYKVELIRENVRRSGLNSVIPVVKDAQELDEAWIRKADVVLADLPCSGYGVIGRKPDIKYHASKLKEAELIRLQRKILENAAAYVREGGTLVYSTCTTNKKENEENVFWFLRHFPFELVSLDDVLDPALRSETTAQGYLQMIPGIHNCDGFFLAKFQRKEDEE
ncbi:MAG: 16S rRNA (cytosine(967)-C(5))-methyltransferase RsmB [Fusicatenibacter sp.]|nr:16S rRNA (cytosine(967)-C(5))-methyltransferase RsmB [Fusicatenibacter sp.]